MWRDSNGGDGTADSFVLYLEGLKSERERKERNAQKQFIKKTN